MDNKIITLIVIVIVIAIGAIYVLANPGDNNTTQNDSVNTTNITNTTDNATRIIQNTTNRSDTKNETPKVNITATQAQKIAIDASADLGFPAKAHGTPTLFRWTANNRHTWVWDVPLEFEAGDQKYGTIYVDAHTGEVIMNE